jgi:GNAT superfamily N-acetyltransferase
MSLVTAGPDYMEANIVTRPLTQDDFQFIVRVIDKWWGGPTSALAHPVWFYELGANAMVAEADGRLVGFLFGFITPEKTTGYVHLVGIDPEYRRKHVGTLLYQTFEKRCAECGCASLKAITNHGNEGSLRFHRALGWEAEEIPDYAGPGRPRVVFTKRLDN